MVEIDAGTFARNALRVHAEGRMGFQNEADRRTGECRYVYPSGSRCAIGAGVSEAEAFMIQKKVDEEVFGSSVSGIIDRHLLRVTSTVLNPDDLLMKLRLIQVSHDNIMTGQTSFSPASQEARMLDLLNELSRLHPEALSELSAQTPAQEA